MTQPETGLDPSRFGASIFDGAWVRPVAGGRLAVDEPATGKVLAEVGLATAADVDRAAQQAAAAQPAWAAGGPAERSAIFRRAAAFLEANREEATSWIVRETGSIPAKAGVELKVAIGELHEAAAMLTQPAGVILPSDGSMLSLARRIPHGIVGVISPFNFPLILSIRAVAPALATGNAVILKPDPQTPFSGGYFIARAFEEAGLPVGLLHVLPGGADVGEAMVDHPQIPMLAFTGSTAVGRAIGARGGALLKKLSLELGGKNSLIILDDADLDLAVSNAAWGAFLHQGQICMATGRVLVPEKMAAAFTAKLAEKADQLPVGDPHRAQVALGPLINRRQVEKVASIVADSVAAGARLRAGGTADGCFFRPTVLDGVTPGMRVFDEEVFGPVASVTVYCDEEEAVKLANATDYGLSAAVLTGNSGRGMAFARQLRTGLVHINDQTVADEPYAPFGGTGASGNGSRHGGPANWDEFTQWQWMTVKDKPPVHPF